MPIDTKQQAIKISSFAANILLILATILLCIHLSAPVLNGNFSIDAILKYSSWLGLAFCLKFEINRLKKKMMMNFFDYTVIVITIIFNIMVWFDFPVSLFLSILCLLGLIIYFNMERKRENTISKKKNY